MRAGRLSLSASEITKQQGLTEVSQTDLLFRNGKFYLALIIDVPEPVVDIPIGDVGVDLGVNNLAVDSDGEFYWGKDVDNVRERIDNLKSDLQSKGTSR